MPADATVAEQLRRSEVRTQAACTQFCCGRQGTCQTELFHLCSCAGHVPVARRAAGPGRHDSAVRLWDLCRFGHRLLNAIMRRAFRTTTYQTWCHQVLLGLHSQLESESMNVSGLSVRRSKRIAQAAGTIRQLSSQLSDYRKTVARASSPDLGVRSLFASWETTGSACLSVSEGLVQNADGGCAAFWQSPERKIRRLEGPPLGTRIASCQWAEELWQIASATVPPLSRGKVAKCTAVRRLRRQTKNPSRSEPQILRSQEAERRCRWCAWTRCCGNWATPCEKLV